MTTFFFERRFLILEGSVLDRVRVWTIYLHFEWGNADRTREGING